MFVDWVEIKIKAGNGGDGKVSFKRAKYKPNGGPDGGDGGRGGSIIFAVNTGMHTLIDFRYARKFHAQNGFNGQSEQKSGKDGEDLVITVPQGTLVRDQETGLVLADLHEPGDRRTVLYGGRGGRGNARFATPTRQAPRFAIPGQAVKEYTVALELKSLADVGLVGYPNAGKSTLLSVISAAKPAIGNYPFTTLSPTLGVVSANGGRSYIAADIPGIIKDAHSGAGLGVDFLRHVERTRILLHVVDMSGMEGRDPLEDYQAIRDELRLYGKGVDQKATVIAANKMDLPESQEHLDRLRAVVPPAVSIYAVSGVTHEGIAPLVAHVADMVDALEPVAPFEEYEPEPLDTSAFEVSKRGDIYWIDGPFVDRLLRSTNLEDEESLRYFQRVLRSRGIIDQLRALGANQGDTVILGEVEFDFID